jgi:hypothetical protein
MLDQGYFQNLEDAAMEQLDKYGGYTEFVRRE